jgi:hypothetical protein
MRGARAAADRVPSGTGSSLARVAMVVRLLTAVALLGAALLIVALVGQGAAMAREAVPSTPGPPDGRNLADVLRASARGEQADPPDQAALPPGTRVQDPALASALVDADRVLDRLPAPTPETGSPARGTTAKASPGPTGEPGPDGAPSGAPVPQLGHGRREPQLVAEAPRLVVSDTDPPGGLGSAAGTLPVGSLTVAAADAHADPPPPPGPPPPPPSPPHPPPPPHPLPGGPPSPPGLPKSWHTVTGIADRVDLQATSLGNLATRLLGIYTVYDPNIPGRNAAQLAASVNAHADAARAHDSKQASAEARAAVDAAIQDLEELSLLAKDAAPRLRESGRRLHDIAADESRAVSQNREATGSYGRYAGQGTEDNPLTTGRTIAENVASRARDLKVDMATLSPLDAVDPRFTSLIEQAEKHAKTAVSYERWPWSSLYSAATVDKEQRKAAHGAIDALDQLVVVVDTIAHRRGKEGDQLDRAAESARQMVEEARRAAANLPQAPPKGSSLDGEPGPDGEPTRHVGGGPERATTGVAVEGGDADGSEGRPPVVLEAGPASGGGLDGSGGVISAGDGTAPPASDGMDLASDGAGDLGSTGSDFA